jgi:hypothetical protein
MLQLDIGTALELSKVSLEGIDFLLRSISQNGRNI